MKTKEYPIKEMVSLKMDENKVWYLEYNKEHESFPPLLRIGKSRFAGGDKIPNKKDYKNLLKQISEYFEKQNLLLEGNGNMVASRYYGHGARLYIGWNNRQLEDSLLNVELPKYLIPNPIDGGKCFPHKIRIVRKCIRIWRYFDSVPYYGNERYKKYVEENNGECPLPLPESIFTPHSLDEEVKDLKI